MVKLEIKIQHQSGLNMFSNHGEIINKYAMI